MQKRVDRWLIISLDREVYRVRASAIVDDITNEFGVPSFFIKNPPDQVKLSIKIITEAHKRISNLDWRAELEKNEQPI